MYLIPELTNDAGIPISANLRSCRRKFFQSVATMAPAAWPMVIATTTDKAERATSIRQSSTVLIDSLHIKDGKHILRITRNRAAWRTH